MHGQLLPQRFNILPTALHGAIPCLYVLISCWSNSLRVQGRRLLWQLKHYSHSWLRQIDFVTQLGRAAWPDMQEWSGDWSDWFILLHRHNLFGFDPSTARRCLRSQVADYRLPIHPASGLHLVFLYEYTCGSLFMFSTDGFGLWWLNFNQRTFPLGVLDEAASGNCDDSRVDNRGSHSLLPLFILPLHH